MLLSEWCLTPPATPSKKGGDAFKGGTVGGSSGGGGHHIVHLHGGARDPALSARITTTGVRFGGTPRLSGNSGGGGGSGSSSSINSSMQIKVSSPAGSVKLPLPLPLPLLSSIVDGGELSEYDGDDEGDGCAPAVDRLSRMDRTLAD